MSSNYLSISKRSLKLNKKRTALLIFGVILSVALITAIGTFFLSMEKDQITREREVGDYHVQYKGVGEEQKNILKNFSSVENSLVYKFIDEGSVGNQMSLFINANEEEIKALGYTLDGRLPQAENEIVINKSEGRTYGKNSDIGDFINVYKNKDNEGAVKYKIVGILKSDKYKPFNETIILSDEFEEVAIVKLIEDKKLRENLDELNSKITNNKTNGIVIDERGSFLTMLGAGSYSNINETQDLIIIILFLIVMVSTAIMIFNAFNISIMERVKEYGLLKAVGATPSQIRSLVFYEAFVIGIIAIPLGMAVGYFGIMFVLKVLGAYIIEEFAKLNIVFSFGVMITSFVLGVITVFLSAIFPTLRAGRVSPLECINESAVKVKRLPKGRVWEKIFKIEGLMAYRNRKINKKRYYITVVAMTISVALFITIAATLKSGLDDYGMYNGGMFIDNSDIYVSPTIGDRDINNGNQEMEKIRGKYKDKYPIIDEIVNGYVPVWTSLLTNDGELNSKISTTKNIEKVNIDGVGYDLSTVTIMPIDKSHEKYLKGYIDSFSYDKLVSENGTIVINEVLGFNNQTQKYAKEELINIGIGDTLKYSRFSMDYYDQFKDKGLDKIKSGIADLKVMGKISLAQQLDSLMILVPVENINKSEFKYVISNGEEINKSDFEIYELGFKISKDAPKEDINKLREELTDDFEGNGYVNDIFAMNEDRVKEEITIKVFVYSFIGIICLISALNIINTVSTNIILRKRELCALRAIGTSYEAMRKMLLMEGLMYGLFSSIAGIIIGLILNKYLSGIIFRVMEGTWTIPYVEIIVAFIGAIALGIISILIPLKKLKNISIIDGIRTLD